MYKLNLTIPWVPATLNVELRKHYHHRQKTNLQWDAYVANLTHGKRPPKPLPFARITITRFAPRFLDYDGLVGSLKPVVDALVTARVLADDSWAVLGPWEVYQVQQSEKDGVPKLEITVESRS